MEFLLESEPVERTRVEKRHSKKELCVSIAVYINDDSISLCPLLLATDGFNEVAVFAWILIRFLALSVSKLFVAADLLSTE